MIHLEIENCWAKKNEYKSKGLEGYKQNNKYKRSRNKEKILQSKYQKNRGYVHG